MTLVPSELLKRQADLNKSLIAERDAALARIKLLEDRLREEARAWGIVHEWARGMDVIEGAESGYSRRAKDILRLLDPGEEAPIVSNCSGDGGGPDVPAYPKRPIPPRLECGCAWTGAPCHHQRRMAATGLIVAGIAAAALIAGLLVALL